MRRISTRTCVTILFSLASFPLGLYLSCRSLNIQAEGPIRELLLTSFQHLRETGKVDRQLFGPDAAEVAAHLFATTNDIQIIEVTDVNIDLLTPMSYFGHMRFSGPGHTIFVRVQGDYTYPIGSKGDNQFEAYGFPIRALVVEERVSGGKL